MRSRSRRISGVAFLPWAVFLSGCGVLGIGPDKEFPEVWVVPVVSIRYAGEVVDHCHERIRDLLVRMNERIYDATDGQVRIAKFVVWKADQISEASPGVGTMIESKKNLSGIGVIGSPDAPGHFKFPLAEGPMDSAWCAGVAAHEWFHAYIGLYDEERCPKEWLKRMETDSCIMDNAWRTELCRGEDHSTDTKQHQIRKMGCYEWLRTVIREKLRREISIPGHYYSGPDDPSKPEIEFRF